MIKKISSILLISMLSISLIACSQPSTSSKEENKVDVNTNVDSKTDLKEEVIIEIPPEKVIQDIFENTRKELDTNYFPGMEIPNEIYEGTYGLNMDDIEYAYGEMPMIMVNIDTFIGIYAKDGKVDNVKNAIQGYINRMKEDTMQYPQNLAKIPAMKMVAKDNYIFLIATFGDAFAKYDEPTDEQILQIAKENVEKTEDIILDYFK